MGTWRARSRQRWRALAAGCTTIVLVAAGAGHAALERAAPRDLEDVASADAADSTVALSGAPVTVPDSDYAYPSDAMFVAPGGNDANAGSLGAPLATVGRAISVATAGATIVLRSGIYREALGTLSKRITL